MVGILVSFLGRPILRFIISVSGRVVGKGTRDIFPFPYLEWPRVVPGSIFGACLLRWNMQPILDDCFFWRGKSAYAEFNPTRCFICKYLLTSRGEHAYILGGDLPCLNSCRPDKCVSKPHGRVECSRKQKETIGSFHLFEILCRYDIYNYTYYTYWSIISTSTFKGVPNGSVTGCQFTIP